VTALALTDDGVTLTIARANGEPQQLMADQVIAAIPPRVLAETVRFTPALDAVIDQRWRHTPTWMAPHAKFVALYDRPFWRDAGLSGMVQSMVGPMPEIHDATTASGQAALFGFVGVGAAQRATLGEPALTTACIAQLARLFGPQAEDPAATLLKDWAADPLTATSADQIATGHPVPEVTPWVQGVWQQRLSLAGSETSPREPGYLAGAVIAARRAVDTLLTRPSTPTPPPAS
jgi:monoamine oxidase